MDAATRRLCSRALACGLLLLLIAPDASALFIVNLPWMRPAKSGQSTEVYMNLTSTDGATLVAVRTDEAKEVVIRGAGKSLRTIPQLPLPAGMLVALAPDQERIALIKVPRTIKLGDRIALTLTIEGLDGVRREIPVLVEARNRSAVDDERRAHQEHPH